MLRKSLAAVILILALSLSACAGEDVVFYNTYLGLEVGVPDGCRVSSHNLTNLSAQPEDTDDIIVLDRQSFGDGNYYVDMIEMDNGKQSTDPGYIGMHVFAEDYSFTYSSFSSYFNACVKTYSGVQADGYYAEYNQTDSDSYINEKQFTKIVYNLTKENSPSFRQEYYLKQVGQMYLTVSVRYPSGDRFARDQKNAMLGYVKVRDNSPVVESYDTSPEELYYANNVFGLSARFWSNEYTATVNDNNVTTEEGEKLQLGSMQKQSYPDGGSYYDIIKIRSAGSDNAEMDIYVDEYPMFATTGDYVEAVKQSKDGMTVDTHDTVELGGITFIRLLLSSQSEREEIYIRNVDGLYLTVQIRYSFGSDKSVNDAQRLLELMSFYEPEVGDQI